jgi:hypothetical protein
MMQQADGRKGSQRTNDSRQTHKTQVVFGYKAIVHSQHCTFAASHADSACFRCTNARVMIGKYRQLAGRLG